MTSQMANRNETLGLSEHENKIFPLANLNSPQIFPVHSLQQPVARDVVGGL